MNELYFKYHLIKGVWFSKSNWKETAVNILNYGLIWSIPTIPCNYCSSLFGAHQNAPITSIHTEVILSSWIELCLLIIGFLYSAFLIDLYYWPVQKRPWYPVAHAHWTFPFPSTEHVPPFLQGCCNWQTKWKNFDLHWSVCVYVENPFLE